MSYRHWLLRNYPAPHWEHSDQPSKTGRTAMNIRANLLQWFLYCLPDSATRLSVGKVAPTYVFPSSPDIFSVSFICGVHVSEQPPVAPPIGNARWVALRLKFVREAITAGEARQTLSGYFVIELPDFLTTGTDGGLLRITKADMEEYLCGV